MSIALSLVLVVLFLAMNAFFVIAEFALVRVRKSQIDMAVERGERGAKNARKIQENINAYLSACQLGITLASLALGWLGEPAFSAIFRPLLAPLGIEGAAVSAISVAVGYLIMTTLHVVVGELIPKSFAIFATERYALSTATPLLWFYRITYPIMVVFNALTNAVVRLAGHDPNEEHEAYTEEEIQILIDESTEKGLIDPEQNEFVDNIFDLGDKDAASIMTPRTDIVCLDLEDTLEESLMAVSQYKFTRYPVCRGDKDRIVGFVHVKDLYLLPQDAELSELPVRPVVAAPETMPLAKLLQLLQANRAKMAVIIDEHGGTAGVVTMTDIMEQVVGPIDDEYFHEDSEDIKQLPDGNYLIDGGAPVDDLIDVLGFEPEQLEDSDTVGGLLLEILGHIPEEGESVTIEGPMTAAGGQAEVTFTVVDMDRFRIDKISMNMVYHAEVEEEAE